MLQKINDQLKIALKSKDELRMSVLRALKTAINNEAIALKKKDAGLDEAESLKAIKREANKRKDAMQAYAQSARADLAEREKKELAVIDEFLPAQLSEAELAKIVEQVIAGNQATGQSNAGQIIGTVMKKAGPTADGSIVSRLVREKINK